MPIRIVMIAVLCLIVGSVLSILVVQRFEPGAESAPSADRLTSTPRQMTQGALQ
ncbi:hypothetical protein LXM94_18465 [Rhizobium sp. TRM95111]|uniref:hypothetical protein n=1 Tax=Rhizobium alarense TaxID=2846851 RepID=UPI001F1BAB30|nr:hypothetical protein [Rhizobium alarense]MCF3641955.1 hypothetical protein [Rhizobium alarense]